METFLELVREIWKGVMRETSAYYFRETVLEQRKTTRRHKQKGGSRNTKYF